MPRNHTVDVLKGMAIFFVVVTHFHWSIAAQKALLFPFWVDMAVPIFMLISGFVGAASFKRHQISKLRQAYTFGQLSRKWLRYTLPYFVAFPLDIALMLLAHQMPASELLTPQALLRSFVEGGYGPGSYYYPILCQLIFVFPLLYRCVERFRLRGVLGCLGLNILYECAKTAGQMSDSTYRLLIFRYLFILSAGIYLFLEQEKRPCTVGQIGMCLTGAGFLLGTQYFGWVFYGLEKWTTTSWLACFYLLPIVARLLKCALHNRILETLGKASYHIFFMQMLYYAFLAEWVYAHCPFTALQLLISVGCSLGLGYGFYKAEAPISKWILAHCRCPA